MIEPIVLVVGSVLIANGLNELLHGESDRIQTEEKGIKTQK